LSGVGTGLLPTGSMIFVGVLNADESLLGNVGAAPVPPASTGASESAGGTSAAGTSTGGGSATGSSDSGSIQPLNLTPDGVVGYSWTTSCQTVVAALSSQLGTNGHPLTTVPPGEVLPPGVSGQLVYNFDNLLLTCYVLTDGSQALGAWSLGASTGSSGPTAFGALSWSASPDQVQSYVPDLEMVPGRHLPWVWQSETTGMFVFSDSDDPTAASIEVGCDAPRFRP